MQEGTLNHFRCVSSEPSPPLLLYDYSWRPQSCGLLSLRSKEQFPRPPGQRKRYQSPVGSLGPVMITDLDRPRHTGRGTLMYLVLYLFLYMVIRYDTFIPDLSRQLVSFRGASCRVRTTGSWSSRWQRGPGSSTTLACSSRLIATRQIQPSRSL